MDIFYQDILFEIIVFKLFERYEAFYNFRHNIVKCV